MFTNEFICAIPFAEKIGDSIAKWFCTSLAQVKFTVKRKRRDFGEFIEFTDSKPTKDSIQECVAFEDKTFDLNKVEVETGMQVRVLLE